MKKRGLKFWQAIALSCAAWLIICIGFAVWFKTQLSAEALSFLVGIIKVHFGPLLILTVLLLLSSALFLDLMLRKYIRPLRKISEQVSLVNPTNPSHRFEITGAAEIQQLCDRLNEGAAHYESLLNDIQGRVNTARAQSEEEKNILAAIMSELPEGVIVCNPDGQILLYNNRAKHMVSGEGDSSHETSIRFIGLGRSVFEVFDENLMRHTIDQITEKLKKNEPNVVYHFVSPGAENTLLRIEAVPVLDYRKHYTGLILILTDITQQLESQNFLNLTLQSFTRGIRASFAGIRSAIETILDFPDMDVNRLETLKQIIHKESLNIGSILERDPTLSSQPMYNQWPLTRIAVRDLFEMLQARCRQNPKLRILTENLSAEHTVSVDHSSFLLALLYIIHQIQTATGVTEMSCRLSELRRFVGLDLLWSGQPIKADVMKDWETRPLTFEKEGLSLTLRQVIDHHNGEIGIYASKRLKNMFYVRFFLPVPYLMRPEKARSLTIIPESRPEFYDFDMFLQVEEQPELQNRNLSKLTYTVFDLETTGLNPTEGDEIISVGAVRIVNGRLLQNERFEQLVDPRRSVPWTSVRIHGIHPEMLEGMPTIDEVLPMFHDFAKDTILLAHNAAFDMRFLQLKEAQTGVRFVNPVLDTLLLSAVVHPSHEDHNLEAIAKRLGVQILARHTAMGDAVSTGEMFLKFLPLLSQQKIFTLKQALEASQKTFYARQKF
ncbi:MAG: exonuclease domain-containing protein [Desulfobacterales bacterium]|jgi:DNA polymerase-3 subunit epsilon